MKPLPAGRHLVTAFRSRNRHGRKGDAKIATFNCVASVAPSSRTLRLCIFAFALLAFACNSNKENKRPMDPWVFRSVLDQKPRMVTAALNENLFVAYDARQCQIYKAWKGGVIFDGAVYTTNHGPQPTSKGYAYYQQPEGESFWFLSKGGTDVDLIPNFQGYKFHDGQVTFKYELSTEDGEKITIEETPEYERNGNKTGLKRTFKTGNVPAGAEVKIKTVLTNLEKENDYETSGNLKVVSKETKTLPAGAVQEVRAELTLKSNDETELTVFFHPGFDSLKEEDKKEEAPADALAQGAKLIDGSDCKTCHNEKVKTVGPAYVDVAKKYEFTEANVSKLVGKVIKGGSGVWGEVPMTAHPDLTEPDAIKMINYIMTLDGEKIAEAENSDNQGVSESYINFPFDSKNEFEKEEDNKDYPGLAVSVYKIENFTQDFYQMPKQYDPMYTAVAPGIHFNVGLTQNNPEINESVLMHFKGFLNITEEDNYVIRLVSDDGARMWIDGKMQIDNDGFHGPQPRDAEMILKKGKHPVEIIYYQGLGGYSLSLQWAKHGDGKFSVIPKESLAHTKASYKKSVPYVPLSKLVKSIPGDKRDEAGVHPAFDLFQARPQGFEPKVGGMDFLSDSSLLVCTWDSVGPVYRLEGVTRNNPDKIKVTRIASGLAEPLGIKVVNDTIYVLQKQELTRLLDNDKDGIIDEYQTVSDDWRVSANFHEFAFGLVYKDGYFYASLATAINPGGASTKPQIPDRGKAVRISKKDGSVEFIASGLRTPNGVGLGVDNELFITDNQGDWLPSSKVLHITKGSWYGSRSVDFEGTANLKEKLPVVWLPQDEIGNSPGQPVPINVGPYKGQQLHGEVTHGGLKRVFMEKVNGEYQGAVFRFSQGLEGGVNRAVWGPDNALYVGMIGNPGNWSHSGRKWYGLQKLKYNGKPVFEMLAVRAKANGMEIEMTEPIADNFGNSISDYEIRQWYYKPTENYGGPKLDEKALTVRAVNISEDRKKVFLEIQGMQPNHVVYVHLKGLFVSKENRNLWTTEAWYTLNSIPNEAGFKRPVAAPVANVLSEKEKADGWKLLFDGKTTSGWRNFKSDKIGAAWKVKDGSLYFDNSKKVNGQTVGGGDIVTADEYENYEFSIEWKVAKCGNSGIIFNAVEDPKYDYVWQTGPEMQVLDNTCHPDARIEKHRAGDLYDLIESKFVAVNPAGEWNQARIISNKGKYEFWLNGYKIVEFTMHDSQWDEMVKKSKFKDMPDFGKATKGRIALQDHGDQVSFRNIKIREIK
ncbi:MAG TPA: family 16 glycoside hydrolase [Chryseosolibacter sp.]